MDISLKINANFSEAQKAFQGLAKESGEAGIAMKKFAKEYADKIVDDFTKKQKLAQAAITATKGATAAIEASTKSYEREIERLIKGGLSPESDAVKKLRGEYINLKSQTDGQTLTVGDLKKKVMDISADYASAAAAAAAAVKAIIVATNATAEAGDAAAKTGRIIGITAEEWQELSYAAEASGVSSDTLKGSMEKLNKTMGDVKNGTGSLTAYLEQNNKSLLKSLQGAGDTEDAFMLLMTAIKDAPDDFTRANLAQQAFGKSGQELILMSKEGADGISSLREEARKYGVISNENAAKSEAYLDAQARMKAANEGFKDSLTVSLMPTMTSFTNSLSGIIAGFTEYINITRKAKEAAKGLEEDDFSAGDTGRIEKLNAELDVYAKKLDEANRQRQKERAQGMPTDIEDSLIRSINAAITATERERDGIIETQKAVEAAAAAEKQAVEIRTDAQKKADEKAEKDAAKLAAEREKANEALRSQTQKYAEQLEELHIKNDNIKNDERQLLELQLEREQAAIKESTATQAQKDQALAGLREVYAEKLKEADAKFEERQTKEAEKASKEREDLIKASIQAITGLEDLGAQERINLLQTQNAEIFSDEELNADARIKLEKLIAEEIKKIEKEEADNSKKAAAERQKNIVDSLTASLNAISSFSDLSTQLEQQNLTERMENMKAGYEKELADAKAAADQQLLDETLTSDERAAIKDALSKKEREISEAQASEEKRLTKEANERNYAAAVANKALQIGQATIQTYMAAAGALGMQPWTPFNFIQMSAAIAAGVANVASISATPLPKLSAETGGSFIASGPPGVDTNLIRVNNGERVDVTPAGQQRSYSGGYNNAGLQSFKDYFWDLCNEGFRRGAIYAMPGGNL
jgi:hypothetical protein